MKAQLLTSTGPLEPARLRLVARPVPEPGPGELLVRVSACGVCHTELDEIEGRLPPRLPVVPGHQIVGRVERTGPGVERFRAGDRVGVAWIHWACGACDACRAGDENLCPWARWTGKDVDGGYAEFTRVPEAFAYPIPERFADAEAAPLLCAGVIGYRALRLSRIANGQVLALYGFGASAHIVIQVARHRLPDSPIFVVTRSATHQAQARRLGAAWVGSPGEPLPGPVHRAIDFTPVGATIRDALAALAPGGRLVVNAIRKRDPVPPLDYATHLWQEKELKSTANVTRRDVEEFLPLAAEIPIVPVVETFRLEAAYEALAKVRAAAVDGAAVLVMTDAREGSPRPRSVSS
jgi:propanol-preferring alcohol dehydrogenase